MKINSKQIASITKEQNPKAILLFGKDSGAVEYYSRVIFSNFASQDSAAQPSFNQAPSIHVFSKEQIASNPYAFIEEALSSSMFASSDQHKILVLESPPESILDKIKDYEASSPINCFLCVKTGTLTPSSKLRSFFEQHSEYTALNCFGDTPATMADFVSQECAKEGFSISKDCINYILSRGNDNRMILLLELQKLFLYKGNDKNITLEDCAIISAGNSSNEELGIIPFYAFDRNSAQAILSFRNHSHKNNSLTILRVLFAYTIKLIKTISIVSEGSSPSDAVSKVKPALFFTEKDRFKKHSSQWKISQLANILAYLNKAEALCKTHNSISPLIVERALLYISKIKR